MLVVGCVFGGSSLSSSACLPSPSAAAVALTEPCLTILPHRCLFTALLAACLLSSRGAGTRQRRRGGAPPAAAAAAHPLPLWLPAAAGGRGRAGCPPVVTPGTRQLRFITVGCGWSGGVVGVGGCRGFRSAGDAAPQRRVRIQLPRLHLAAAGASVPGERGGARGCGPGGWICAGMCDARSQRRHW